MGTALKVWLVVCAVAIAIHLGGPPLLDPDEGRNAEVGREMAVTNDYVVPRLNTLPYLDKPIVYFAAEAAFMEVLGPTELAARLPAYLFTLASAALIVWWTRRRIGAEQAWIAGITFLAMPLTVAFARIVIFDSALTFFVVAAIVALYEAVETKDKRWTAAAWAAIACGVLTKGPVAIALPLLVVIPYAILRRSFRMLGSVAGVVLFVAIITPWVWAMSLVIPEFLPYVLVTETAERLATDELGRTEPVWFFIPYLIGGALPWSIVALASWRSWKRPDPLVVFVLLWIAVPFVFFTLSQSKQPQYLLPVMPAVAVLIASRWDSLRMRAAAIAVGTLGAIVFAAAFTPPLVARLRPELLGTVRSTAIALGAVMVAAGVAAALTRRGIAAIVALSVPVIALPLIANPLMETLGHRRSTETLARQIHDAVGRATPIIGIQTFTGSLAFYLRRPIIVATPDGSELTSNYILRNYEDFASREEWPIETPSWLERNLRECCNPRVYIVRTKHVHHQQRLEAMGARRLAEGARHIAYLWSGRRGS